MKIETKFNVGDIVYCATANNEIASFKIEKIDIELTELGNTITYISTYSNSRIESDLYATKVEVYLLLNARLQKQLL